MSTLECNVCYNQMIWNVKSTDCIDHHAICASCFFLNKSYKCVYCRQMIDIIEIRENLKVVSITNCITNYVLLYYALKNEVDINRISWETAITNFDPDDIFSDVRRIVSNNYPMIDILIGLYHVIAFFSIYSLNEVCIYGTYCIDGICYTASFYWAYILISTILSINILLAWGYLFCKYTQRSIRYKLYNRLIN
jgi:hypothetical protein